MAAPISNDRKQAANVRRLLLSEIERLFTTDPLKLSETEHGTKRELLLRMAANTLPRLNEHTGADGADLFPQPLLAGKSNVPDNNSTEQTPSTDQAD